MGIFKFCKNVLRLKTNDIVSISIENVNDKKAIELNQQQLIKGYDSNSNEMPEYSKRTKQIKAETGGYISPSGRIALKDEGDFFNDMRVFKEPEFFALTSEDQKTNMLIDRYGKDVLGLTEKDSETIIQETRTKTIEEIEKRIYT